MDIDFPLILVVLTGVALLLWLFDVAMLAPQRRGRVAALQARYPAWAQAGSTDERAYAEEAGRAQRMPVAVEYARSFLPVLAIVLVLRSFLVEPFQIPSSSMVPTLLVGDYILVNKFAFGVRLPVVNWKVLDVGEPRRGDVMVFIQPKVKRYFIKRVIGLPGDRIEYRGKVLFVNGKEMRQELMMELPPLQPQYQIVDENLDGVSHVVRKELMSFGTGDFSVEVQPGHYFMMGDNRDNSSDSREWGQVPENLIVGKAFAIWMHWSSFFSLPDFSRVGTIR